jgi:hypothetical protein
LPFRFHAREFTWDETAEEKQKQDLADLEAEEKELWVSIFILSVPNPDSTLHSYLLDLDRSLATVTYELLRGIPITCALEDSAGLCRKRSPIWTACGVFRCGREGKYATVLCEICLWVARTDSGLSFLIARFEELAQDAQVAFWLLYFPNHEGEEGSWLERRGCWRRVRRNHGSGILRLRPVRSPGSAGIKGLFPSCNALDVGNDRSYDCCIYPRYYPEKLDCC